MNEILKYIEWQGRMTAPPASGRTGAPIAIQSRSGSASGAILPARPSGKLLSHRVHGSGEGGRVVAKMLHTQGAQSLWAMETRQERISRGSEPLRPLAP
jgi:hypothetical protein